jgi:hypothetical protein
MLALVTSTVKHHSKYFNQSFLLGIGLLAVAVPWSVNVLRGDSDEYQTTA